MPAIDKIQDIFRDVITEFPYGSVNIELLASDAPRRKRANQYLKLYEHDSAQKMKHQSVMQLSPAELSDMKARISFLHRLYNSDLTKTNAENSSMPVSRTINYSEYKLFIYFWKYLLYRNHQVADCVVLSMALFLKIALDENELQPRSLIRRVESYVVSAADGQTQKNLHMFLLINRTRGELSNPATWNLDTIIADPWHKVIFTADRLSVFSPILPYTKFCYAAPLITTNGIVFRPAISVELDSNELLPHFRDRIKNLTWFFSNENKQHYDFSLASQHKMKYTLYA